VILAIFSVRLKPYSHIRAQYDCDGLWRATSSLQTRYDDLTTIFTRVYIR